MNFEKSLALQPRFHAIIPGGSHTYAKGDDQFPEFMPPYIVRGAGSHVWDVDGNEFIEYGSGLRSVTLGHAYKPVVEAACKQMQLGNNFIRPSTIELEAAELLLSFIEGSEMVKFAKNGSDANNAAVKVSRAYTGRDYVAICATHPFFSVDDWFIGSTAMGAGVPKAIRDLTLKFSYNDIDSLTSLFNSHPGKIACVILEPEKEQPPLDGFLHKVQEVCKRNGALMILDEMITGFRWHNGGAQKYHNIIPDLSTFGKALGNGFSIAALVGKRDIMKLGGMHHDKERVFLVSTTHGAEGHSLAAAMETMRIYRKEPVVETLWRQGEKLAAGINAAAKKHNLEKQVSVFGRPCCLVYGTRDGSGNPSQPLRTVLIQELMKRGILASSLVLSYSHTNEDIDRTIAAFDGALEVYRAAIENGIEKYLIGRPVKPVMRQYN
jgi:glutamate-1-semialdehyde 2,1-aminomutase